MTVLHFKTTTKNDESTDKTVSAFFAFFMPILMALRMSTWDVVHLFVAGWEMQPPRNIDS